MDQSVIKTAGRVFEVLEYLREVRRPVTVREISERLAYPLSSAQVLLKSIATLGYLRYDPSVRAYLASPRLASVGDWVLDTMFQGAQVLDALAEISHESGFTAILAVENDIYAQYVQVILGSGAIQFNAQPGTRRLVCMSGMGWALLAANTDEHVERAIHRSNIRLQPGGQSIDGALVRARVAETRRQGYAFSKGTVTEGVGIVALASQAPDVGAQFAVGFGGLVQALEGAVGSLVPLLQALLRSAATAPVARKTAAVAKSPRAARS